jgi:hypothetical protein
MTTIIDGFNLIYKIPALEGLMYTGELELACKKLVRLLNKYSEACTSKKIKKIKEISANFIVVFDGKKKPGLDIKIEKVMNVEIHYSHDLSADHLIKKFVKKSANPKSLSVVTSDNDIIFSTRLYQTNQIKSEDFSQILQNAIRQIEQKETISPETDANLKLSPEEIAYWEKIFKK